MVIVIKLNECQQNLLDIFRISAAFMVLIGHSFSFYQFTILKNEEYFPYIQNVGVVMFFLLSGFLSVYSIRKKNRDNEYTFSAYFLHKFIRINKEYIPGLVIIAMIDCISIFINGELYRYYDAFDLQQFTSNILMLQNMGPKGILGKYFIPFGSGRPLWTLSVEWWLYMLFGFLFLVINNKNKIGIKKLMLLLMIVFMSSHYLIAGRGGGLGFVFLLGVFTYYCHALLNYRTALVLFVLSLAVYFLYGALLKDAYTVYSFFIIMMIFVSMLRIGAQYNKERSHIISFVSKSTFMLYIIHYSVIDLIYSCRYPLDNRIKFILGIIISMILAGFFYYVLVEKNIFAIFFRKHVKRSNENV